MDQLGFQAMKHAQQYCPERFGRLADPISFFYDLGEQMRDRVMEWEEALDSQAPPDESWIDRVGRLNRDRRETEVAVYSEMFLAAWPSEADLTEDQDSHQEPWLNLNPPMTPEEGGPEPQS